MTPNPEAVAWLESRFIDLQAACRVYQEAGDYDPVVHTKLFTLKQDHEMASTVTGCYMCGPIRLPEHPTAHHLIVIDHDE